MKVLKKKICEWQNWSGLGVKKSKGQKRHMKWSVHGDKKGKGYGKIKLKGQH